MWRTDVVVAANTLQGTDDDPAMVPGWGAITADTARFLASGLADAPAARPSGGFGPEGTWRRILTDPQSGLVKDYGTTRYRPPQALADYIRTRDGRC